MLTYTILSLVAVTFAALVVSSSNTIYSLIYLIALFLSVACLLISQGFTYVGILYIVVYVGAIAILFLFVIMIINVRDVELNTIGSKYTQSLPLTFVLGAIAIYIFTSFAGPEKLSSTSRPLSTVYSGWSLPDQFFICNTDHGYNPLIDLGINADSSLSSFTIVESLGHTLYSIGGIWLFLAAIILLLCIVGPIVLTIQKNDGKPIIK